MLRHAVAHGRRRDARSELLGPVAAADAEAAAAAAAASVLLP